MPVADVRPRFPCPVGGQLEDDACLRINGRYEGRELWYDGTSPVGHRRRPGNIRRLVIGLALGLAELERVLASPQAEDGQ